MQREFLSNVTLFNSFSEDDLVRICGMIQEIELATGEVLFEEGSIGDRAYVIKEGEIEIFKTSAGFEVLLAIRGSGEVIGEMSLLEQLPRIATARARTHCHLIVISQQQFNVLLETSPSAARNMLDTVLERWRETMSTVQQREKMAQLGGLVAGVAHELNNPAAAAQRAAEQMQMKITGLVKNQIVLGQLDSNQWLRLSPLVEEAQKLAIDPPPLDPLERSDREEALEVWLGAREVEQPWEYASALVSLGYEPDSFSALLADIDNSYLPAIVGWVCDMYNAYRLSEEISEGSRRVSEIVQALKSYSYLDQGPIQTVDIHRDIDNTLIILNHKLRDAKIQVTCEYAADLRDIEAYGSDLSQVWTNLIDNAIDALSENSEESPREIVIRTQQTDQEVVVEIEDNGPGIPEAIQRKIFEAFFTTKPPGKGTGLGLDISYNIVVLKHGGNLRVVSEPGRTCFEIRIPLQVKAR